MRKSIYIFVLSLLSTACATQTMNEPVIERQNSQEFLNVKSAAEIALENKDFLNRRKAVKLALLCSNPTTQLNGISEPNNSLAPISLVRLPPLIPPMAKSSGRVSLIFDLNDEGDTQNIRIMDASDEVFITSAMKSVEKWRYNRASNDRPTIYRKNICVALNFSVSDMEGNVLPYRRDLAPF